MGVNSSREAYNSGQSASINLPYISSKKYKARVEQQKLVAGNSSITTRIFSPEGKLLKFDILDNFRGEKNVMLLLETGTNHHLPR